MDGVSTLAVAAGATLGGGPFLRIAAILSKTIACFDLYHTGIDSVPSIALTTSSTPRMVQSCLDRDGSV